MNPILSSLINSEIDVSNLLFQFESLISNLIRDLNAEVSTPRNNDPKKISQNIPSQSDMVLQQLKYFQTLYKDKLNDYRMKKFTFNRLCQQEYLQTKCYDFSGKLNTQIDLSQVQTIDASILLTTLNKLEQAYNYNSLIEQKYQSQYQQILEATKYLKSFNEAHEADKKQKEEEQKKREEERNQKLQEEKLRGEQEEVERDRDAERQKIESQAAQQVVNPQVQVHNPQQQEISKMITYYKMNKPQKMIEIQTRWNLEISAFSVTTKLKRRDFNLFVNTLFMKNVSKNKFSMLSIKAALQCIALATHQLILN